MKGQLPLKWKFLEFLSGLGLRDLEKPRTGLATSKRRYGKVSYLCKQGFRYGASAPGLGVDPGPYALHPDRGTRPNPQSEDLGAQRVWTLQLMGKNNDNHTNVGRMIIVIIIVVTT